VDWGGDLLWNKSGGPQVTIPVCKCRSGREKKNGEGKTCRHDVQKKKSRWFCDSGEHVPKKKEAFELSLKKSSPINSQRTRKVDKVGKNKRRGERDLVKMGWWVARIGKWGSGKIGPPRGEKGGIDAF